MPRDPREAHHRLLLSEIDEERGAALSRIGRRFEGTLRRCEALLAALDTTPAGPEHDRLLEEYRSARIDSQRARRDYSIQRQALGLVDRERVDRYYPHPPAR